MTTLDRIDDFDPVVESISTYLERVQLFFVANNVEDARKSAVLLSLLGGKVYGTLRNLLSPKQPAGKSYDELKTVLKAHYEPKPIIIAEQFHFHKHIQNPTESIAEFVAELNRLAATCEFGRYLNNALRDRFVCGLLHEGMQKRLLSEPDLTFTRAVEIAQGIAAAEKNIQDFRRKEITTVGKVSFAATQKDTIVFKLKAAVVIVVVLTIYRRIVTSRKLCHNCEKKGHIASICRAPKRQKGQVRSKSTYKNRGNTKWLQQATSQEEELLMLHLGSSAS